MLNLFRSRNHWKKQPKDGVSRGLNHSSQPPRERRVFNRAGVLTESWYPLFRSRGLKKREVRSATLGSQRVAVFRTESGKLAAVDAFCAHMGADLGNGSVCGERLRCYFHRWEYDAGGGLQKVPCLEGKVPNARLNSYPVAEKFGHIWVYAGKEAPGPVPDPAGLPQAEGHLFGETTLFVHHHALMASAIDLQHFASVHALNLDFDYRVEGIGDDRDVWRVRGKIPRRGLRDLAARFLLGDTIEYHATFSGGNIVALEYGAGARLFGRGPELPKLCVLWAATPLENGISRAKIFLAHPRGTGVLGKIGRTLLSLLLLAWLKDDDVKAYPHMRFQVGTTVPGDESVLRLVQAIERQRISTWSYGDSALRNGSLGNSSSGCGKGISSSPEP